MSLECFSFPSMVLPVVIRVCQLHLSYADCLFIYFLIIILFKFTPTYVHTCIYIHTHTRIYMYVCMYVYGFLSQLVKQMLEKFGSDPQKTFCF